MIAKKNINSKKLISAWSGFMRQQHTIAATTIQFNRNPSSYVRSDTGAMRDVAWVRQRVSAMVLRLDNLYFNTADAVSRVAANDRFDAFCVVEKVGVSPHVHMSWFIPRCERPEPQAMSTINWLLDRRKRAVELLLREQEIEDRLCCILEVFNRDPGRLTASESLLLKTHSSRRIGFRPDAIADWHRLGWSVKSSSIVGEDWQGYMMKEMKFECDFTDRLFLLSELRSENQRTRPTRYYNRDRVTHAPVLNLDLALVPIK